MTIAVLGIAGLFATAWAPTYLRAYVANCGPADRIIMEYARLPGYELDKYFAKLTWRDGVPVPKNKPDKHNPWNIALAGLYNLERYCETGDPKRLEAAITQRRWLAENVTASNEELGLLRWSYDFQNKPYASKAGWGSAMSQSAGTLLMQLVHPRFDRQDTAKVRNTIRTSLHPVADGGTYSPYGDGLIFWEEVATHERPSTIINGAQVASFYYDLVAEQMPTGEMRGKLLDLNDKAIKALLSVQDEMMATDKPGHILYDLTTSPPNLRKKGHYAYKIAVWWLEWVGRNGTDVTAIQNKLKRITVAPKTAQQN